MVAVDKKQLNTRQPTGMPLIQRQVFKDGGSKTG